LTNGSNISYGKGIYCSPNAEIASQFCSSECEIDTIDGKKKFQYVFMCRVNCSKIHQCPNGICPEAENPEYSLHFTSKEDYWFVNKNNIHYENIRPYGVLVREVK
jgi:hypothetical protein